MFHTAWTGNFTLWCNDPIHSVSLAHILVDLNLVSFSPIISYSGVYYILLSLGFRSQVDIYKGALVCLVIGLLMISIFISSVSLKYSNIHSNLLIKYIRILFKFNSIFKSPLWVLGCASLLWSLHLLFFGCLSFPFVIGGYSDYFPLGYYLEMFNNTLCNISWEISISDWCGSLNYSCIFHHHLALGFTLLWLNNFVSLIKVSSYKPIPYSNYKSLHLTICMLLVLLGSASGWLCFCISYIPVFKFLVFDRLTLVSLKCHHIFIQFIFYIGSFAHLGIYFIRDYSELCTNNILSKLIKHKEVIVSYLSYVSLFLGFHCLLLYVHNDTVCSFNYSYLEVIIDPVIIRILNIFYLKVFGILLVNYYSTLGFKDFIIIHSISFGLHVSSLILVKGCLDSRGSRLFPDKYLIGFGFPCDGPSRGGTCDISCWDSIYLATFWVVNTVSWLLFYIHWKALISNNLLRLEMFLYSSTYLNGWFRDYLWLSSSYIISSYSFLGSLFISSLGWLFLLAHLIWATSFMFLISWRGYWQELIDILSFIYYKTSFILQIWRTIRVSPSALSIVQARAIGLIHFCVGLILTYASFTVSL